MRQLRPLVHETVVVDNGGEHSRLASDDDARAFLRLCHGVATDPGACRLPDAQRDFASSFRWQWFEPLRAPASRHLDKDAL